MGAPDEDRPDDEPADEEDCIEEFDCTDGQEGAVLLILSADAHGEVPGADDEVEGLGGGSEDEPLEHIEVKVGVRDGPGGGVGLEEGEDEGEGGDGEVREEGGGGDPVELLLHSNTGGS